MAITVAQKAQIMTDFQRAAGDTGSAEVQIALLTRLNVPEEYLPLYLTEGAQEAREGN